MLTVLITGFEPFDGAAENPSAEAVAALLADPPPGIRLVGAILPVTYAEAGPALRGAVQRHAPDILLSTGLAGGRAELSVERVAINIDDARIADNAGVWRIDTPVVAGGPAAYFSGLPIKAMAAAIRAAGTPAQVSQTAGTFLCNHVFYLGCHLAARERPGMRAGFVHMPYLPGQVASRPGAPSLPLSAIVAGLRAAMLTAATRADDLTEAAGAVS